MHAWARAAVTTAITIWLTVVIVGAVSIYGFGQYDSAWGRGGSLQVYVWIATGTSVIACFGSGLGFRVGAGSGGVPGRAGVVTTGVVALALSVAVLALVTYPTDIAVLVVGGSFFLVPAVVAYVACKLAGRRRIHAV